MISKVQLGEFDNISIFSEEYIMVERKGLFNLIDNSGEYVSKTWFKSITKNSGGADFVETKSENKIQLRSIPMLKTYSSLRNALNDTTILSRIDTRCIVMVSPYKAYSATTRRNVTIIAKVNILGKELLLGKNGKLYTKCGLGSCEEYHLPEFFLSWTDINRLVEVADKFNCVYHSDYDVANKPKEDKYSLLKESKASCWIFGFDNSGKMAFLTYLNPCIHHIDTKAWGGDTIKVRFDSNLLPEKYRTKIVNALDNLGFENLPNGKTPAWYTKTYKLKELNMLFDDMEVLCQKYSYVEC